jgi:hypothetical protein
MENLSLVLYPFIYIFIYVIENGYKNNEMKKEKLIENLNNEFEKRKENIKKMLIELSKFGIYYSVDETNLYDDNKINFINYTDNIINKMIEYYKNIINRLGETENDISYDIYLKFITSDIYLNIDKFYLIIYIIKCIYASSNLVNSFLKINNGDYFDNLNNKLLDILYYKYLDLNDIDIKKIVENPNIEISFLGGCKKRYCGGDVYVSKRPENIKKLAKDINSGLLEEEQPYLNNIFIDNDEK